MLICLVLHPLHASFSFFFHGIRLSFDKLCWHFNQLCTVLQENALLHAVCYIVHVKLKKRVVMDVFRNGRKPRMILIYNCKLQYAVHVY